MARRQRTSYSTKGLSFYQDESGINFHLIREILLWILTTIIAAGLAFVLVIAYGFRVSVIGDSMTPAIAEGQTVLVNRLQYRLTSPKREDVVAFYAGGNEDTHPYVKRIAAMPEETVQIVDGQLLINGVPDIHSEAYDKMQDPGMAAQEITLGENEYFVLGDNRNSSEDSRDASIGIVTADEIIGQTWLALPSAGGSLHRVE